MHARHRLLVASMLQILVLSSAAAAPKVLICAADSTNASTVQAKLNATKMFDSVDVLNCQTSTPTLQQLNGYQAVLTWSSSQYQNAAQLGNNLADYLEGGGGVVTLLYSNYSGWALTGKWQTNGDNCLTTAGNTYSSTLKPQPNDAQSPLVQGVTKFSQTTYHGYSSLNVAKGAVSVWDFVSNYPAICKMSVNGHYSVALNFYPGNAPVEAYTLIANAALFVAGGAGPFQAVPSKVAFPDTGTGATAQTVTVVLTNSSMNQATATKLSIVGPNAGDFSIVDPSMDKFPITVAAGGSFKVQLTFSPTAIGARVATLQVGVQGQMSTNDVQLAGNGIGPKLVLSPPSIKMGAAQLNVTVKKSVTVTNQGGLTAVTGATVNGGSDFKLSGAVVYPVMLPQGGSFDEVVLFTPTVTGTQKAEVIFTTNDPNNPSIKLQIEGRSGPPKIALGTGTFAFGTTNVGASTPPQSIAISNTGNSDLVVSDITLGGANPGDYKLDKKGVPGTPIPPDGMASFTIAFAPTATGVRVASVSIASNDAQSGTKSIALTGTGTVATLSLTPASLAFGDVKAGKPSASQTVTLTNTGSGTLQVSGFTVEGPAASSFAITSGPTPPLSLAANGTATVGLQCNPKMVGSLSASFTVITDVGQKSVALTCSGIAPMVSVAPNKLDFGSVAVNGDSPPQTITISNTGKSDLSLSAVKITGASAGDFKSNDLPGAMTLQPGQSVKTTITFSPSIQANESATLLVTSDDPAMPMLSVPLSGVGVQLGLTVTPLELNFGSIALGRTGGPQSVTLTNTGTAPLMIANPVLGGPEANAFSLGASGPMTLPVGGTAKIDVTFSPTTAGVAQAQLIVSPVGLAMAQVLLRGTATSPMISVTPNDTLDFGPIKVGNRSFAQSLSIKNGSDAPQMLTITSTSAEFLVDQAKLTLAKGDVAKVAVSFAPSAVHNAKGDIEVRVVGLSTTLAKVHAIGQGAPADAGGGTGCSVGATRQAPATGLATLLLALALGLGGAASARAGGWIRRRSGGRRATSRAA